MGRKAKEENLVLREHRKTAILEAALETYIEAGFNGADMDLVAERAGLAKGLLYYYYPGKKQLFKALFELCLERSAAREQELVQSLSAHGPAEKMVHYAWGFFLLAVSDPLLIRFAMRLPFDAFAVFGKEGWADGMRKASLHQQSITAIVQGLVDADLISLPDVAGAASSLWAVLMNSFLDVARMSAAAPGDAEYGSRDADLGRIAAAFGFGFRGLGLPDNAWKPLLDDLIAQYQ